jgi:nitrogen permease regulator 3-like protein
VQPGDSEIWGTALHQWRWKDDTPSRFVLPLGFAISINLAMAHPVLPSPSNVLAVALVTNTLKGGTEIVFQYPPENWMDSSGPSAVEGSGDLFDPDDIILERLLSQTEDARSPQTFGHKRNDNEYLMTDSGKHEAPWERLAGYPTEDLASLLSPGRSYHKKLFQVSLDNLHFISCPVFVPENGIWKKKRKTGKAKPQPDSLVLPSETDIVARNGTNKLPSAEELAQKTADDIGDKEKEREREREKEKEDKISALSMFNIVFILTPSRHEVRDLVNTLHANIIKKVNRAFRYSQRQNDFIWKECKRIQDLKEKGRDESMTAPSIAFSSTWLRVNTWTQKRR